MELNSTNLRQALISGSNNLYNFYPQIDKLNVFPVPDGDTGINMHLTIQSGINNISDIKEPKLQEITSCFSRGLIMGARGNSGVIFSQIIRGLFEGIPKNGIIEPKYFANMFAQAQNVAYKAVMKPVEGTILTVIREISESFDVMTSASSLGDIFSHVVIVANKSLENTPNLLPILKEVGVVDSGGFGLVKFLEGMERYIATGKIIDREKSPKKGSGGPLNIVLKKEYGYCCEAIVFIKKKNIQEFHTNKIRQTLLDQKCDSIVAIQDQDILKVHAHSTQPGVLLTFLQQFGEFQNVKVDNMSLQAKSHAQSFATERKLRNEWAIIPIVPTREVADYFHKTFKIGNCIISGKFMNPPVEDILDKIKEVDANHVYILPNNKNCILAAEHAAKLEKLSSVYIISTKHISEGMAAIIPYNPLDTARRNTQTMRQALKNVKTAIITRSNKKTVLNNVVIGVRDYFVVINEKVTLANPNLSTLTQKTIEKITNKSSEIVTVFYHHKLDLNIINALRKYLDENFDVEYDFVNCGAIVNQLIIAVE